jgi:hypothetical protein
VQFHPPALIYVLDPSITAIQYSFDGKTWERAEGLRIAGAGLRWAEARLSSTVIDRLNTAARQNTANPSKLMIRYLDQQGSPSDVWNFDARVPEQTNGGLPPDVADAIKHAKESIRGAKEQVRRLNEEFVEPHRDPGPGR